MFRGRRVAVVIPAYNEADKIAATIRSVPGFVDHILVVDDGSSDGTAAVARRAGRRGGGRVVEVLAHARNRGVGAAVASGYVRAIDLGAHVTAVMAGDGQMDPADLPRLLAPVVGGAADYAKGNRFAWPGCWGQMPQTRALGNVALSLLTRLSSGYWHLFDSQCGYTAASRRALQAIDPARLFARYGYPNDLLARLGAAGGRVVDVPVRPVYGPTWRSGLRPSRVALPILLVLVRSAWRRLRARLAGVPPQLSATVEDEPALGPADALGTSSQ
jgi:glycosyltransferase involved in cell wall biosynthesis